MSAYELKQALKSIPGSENLTVSYGPNGNQLITIADKTVEVRPAASNAEIALAFSNPLIATENTTLTGKTKMSTPAPGGFVASVKAMMEDARKGVAQARADGLAQVGDAVGKLNEAKTATLNVAGTMAKTIQDEAALILSELGQISNDLNGEAG